MAEKLKLIGAKPYKKALLAGPALKMKNVIIPAQD